MDHIGIDLHKKESQICILGAGGELSEQRVRTTPDRFADVLGDRPRARILLEASTESEWLARCLEGLGHEVIVADPNFAPMYATRSRRIKTDRRDARALAEACRLGAYRPAHRLSDAQRHVRGRLTVRDALVRTRTQYISVIRALLRQHGWRVPTGSAESFMRRVLALALPGRLLSELAPLLAVMRQVNQQLTYSDERIAAVARADERVQRLQTVPCVGPVTAAAFVAALDDASRFATAHQVEAYLGLVPREWSSGEGQRRGRITKAGHRRVRSLLVQVAVSIRRVRHPTTTALREWAERLAARRGRFITVVALARRLAGILGNSRCQCATSSLRFSDKMRHLLNLLGRFLMDDGEGDRRASWGWEPNSRPGGPAVEGRRGSRIDCEEGGGYHPIPPPGSIRRSRAFRPGEACRAAGSCRP
jgi:transposase